MAISVASNVQAYLVKQVLLSQAKIPHHLTTDHVTDCLCLKLTLLHVTRALLLNTRFQNSCPCLQVRLGLSPPPSNAREWPLYGETCCLLFCSCLLLPHVVSTLI